MWKFRKDLLQPILNSTERGIENMLCQSMRDNFDEWKEESGYDRTLGTYIKLIRGGIELHVYETYRGHELENLVRVYVYHPHGTTRITDKLWKIRKKINQSRYDAEEQERLNLQYNAIQVEVLCPVKSK